MNRIANPALMIKMLRDAGYKNTSYAVAELVDNSIEAKAKNIRIALFEENVTNVRTQQLINEIAIFDDGEVINQMNDEIPWNTPLAECVALLMQSYADNGYGDGEGSYIMLSIGKYWTLFGRKITPMQEVFFFAE